MPGQTTRERAQSPHTTPSARTLRMKKTSTAEGPRRAQGPLPPQMMHEGLGVVRRKWGSVVKQAWFVSRFYHFSGKVTVGGYLTRRSLRIPIYKMGIITIATFQGFEDANDTACVKHVVRYLHGPCKCSVVSSCCYWWCFCEASLLSQVYYHQNKRDHPGGGVPVVSLARVSVAPGRTGVSEWMVRLGRQSQAFPGAGCRRKGCHITPLLPGQARLLWSGTEVGLSGCLRNNQVYQLRAVALGLRASLPPAQLPECCALAIVPGHTWGLR